MNRMIHIEVLQEAQFILFSANIIDVGVLQETKRFLFCNFSWSLCIWKLSCYVGLKLLVINSLQWMDT